MHVRVHSIMHKETHLLDYIRYIRSWKSKILESTSKTTVSGGILKGDEKEALSLNLVSFGEGQIKNNSTLLD